ncbi:MAG: efflux RND transporter periplasmic adaptor subunit [Sulfitobacter sp.]
MQLFKRSLCFIATSFLMVGCLPEDDSAENAEPQVRGLKTVLVSESESTVLRRYPSVLQPSELTSIGFEISGRVQALDLRVGQLVKKGELLAQLDATALDIQIASAEAAVEQARVAAENSAENLTRQEELLTRGVVTKVAVDNARVEATANAQALVQAERALDSAKKTGGDTDLLAPFDGLISSVDAQSYATVSAGTPIATLYRSDGFEVTFTVNYDTINQMVVGKPATLRLADAPDRTLRGVVTELGASADTVSSFPVVVSVQDAPADIKSGMAVEVNLEFDLPAEQGFTIPISAAVIEGTNTGSRNPTEPAPIKLFVYDPASQTVNKREVMIAGVRENSVLVVSGLEVGERVASAGVSFLTDGQPVTLLED